MARKKKKKHGTVDSYNAIRQSSTVPDRTEPRLLVGIDLGRYLAAEALNLIIKVDKTSALGDNNIPWIYHRFQGMERHLRDQVRILIKGEEDGATTVKTLTFVMKQTTWEVVKSEQWS